MQEKLVKAKQRYQELESLLADPQVFSNQSTYQKLAKEYSELSGVVTVFREYENAVSQAEELRKLLQENHDEEFKQLARSELFELDKKQKDFLKRINDLLNPKRVEEDHNLIIEIRAGTGGEEASLFAADLYRMYTKYADQKGWVIEPISSNPTETGGFKEVIFSINGKGASKCLKWESGAHRVQRVPATEASGRIHTSAATVAVLYEPEEIEVAIDAKDLKIDVFRSSGPGGQSVNTTDSAIRITHIPTGMVVTCQDERSQLKNRNKAMRVLRARLLDKMKQEQFAEKSQDRKLKIGSGDRSEKIRTYNYPDRRITDHRIGFTTHQLLSVMDGDLEDMIEALLKADEEQMMENGKG